MMDFKLTEKFLFVVRHGERSDYVYNATPINSDDPNLTKHGKKQAKKTGEFLGSKLARFNPKVRIIASPLIRTIQTAFEIAKQLGVAEIEIDNRFIERMNPDIMSVDSDKLEIRTKSLEYIKDTYLGDEGRNDITLIDNNSDYSHLDLKRCESRHSSRNRVMKYFNQVISDEIDTKEYDATIVVTHGFVVDEFSYQY